MTKEKKRAMKLCDDLWAKLVKARAGFKCEFCGAVDNLNSHHIFSRANKSVRHDPENGCCLCCRDHAMSSRFSAHLTPTDFTLWIIEKRGKEWHAKLRLKAQTPLRGVDYGLLALWLEKELTSL